MSSYVYRRLDTASKQIRLVRVEKSSDKAAPIHLTLRHANLGQGEEYNALSYTWGRSYVWHDIVVSDDVGTGRVSISVNLHDFLLAARDSTAEWSTAWLWIDQICIHQEDHDERCHQVSQMADVYSQTQATLAWPGVTTDKSQPLFSSEEIEEILCIYRTANTEATDDLSRALAGFINLQGKEVPDMAIKLLRDITVSSVDLLLRSRYWHRVWIIQEICLPPKVRMIAQNNLCDLLDIQCALSILINIGTGKHRTSSCIEKSWIGKLTRLYLRLILLQDKRNMRGENGPNCFNWDSVLGLLFKTDCTVPLDRVYGLSGLVAENQRVYPDYTITSHELLRRILGKQLQYSEHSWVALWSILRHWWVYADFQPVTPTEDYEDLDDATLCLLVITYHTRKALLTLDVEVPTPPHVSAVAYVHWKEATKILQLAQQSCQAPEQLALRLTELNSGGVTEGTGKAIDLLQRLVVLVQEEADRDFGQRTDRGSDLTYGTLGEGQELAEEKCAERKQNGVAQPEPLDLQGNVGRDVEEFIIWLAEAQEESLKEANST